MKPRGAERIRSLLGGQIIFNNQSSTVECQIRNISALGAKLNISSMVSLPEEFELSIPQKGRTFKARLRWRVDESAGVEFLDVPKAQRADQRLNERLRYLEAENETLREELRALRRAPSQAPESALED